MSRQIGRAGRLNVQWTTRTHTGRPAYNNQLVLPVLYNLQGYQLICGY